MLEDMNTGKNWHFKGVLGPEVINVGFFFLFVLFSKFSILDLNYFYLKINTNEREREKGKEGGKWKKEGQQERGGGKQGRG